MNYGLFVDLCGLTRHFHATKALFADKARERPHWLICTSE